NPESRLKSYPHELSGGQRQRVMIAMALANKPKILLADEPTTALDVTVQKQILDLIQDLKQQLNMGVMLISHDLGVVKRYSDTIAVMRDGEVVEQGAASDIFKSPSHPYTHELIAADPKGSPLTRRGHGSRDGNALSASNLSVKFPLNKPLFRKPTQWLHAVDKVDIQVKKGETLGIIGESGSGKSTLAMALLGLQRSDGDVFFEQTPLHTLTSKQLRPYRQWLQVVFQDPFASLSPRMTIAQIVAEGLVVFKRELTKQQIEQQVDEVLKEVGLNTEINHRYPHEFSGGQRQRIAIARALILRPRVIVLDEPTSALDRAVQAQVVELLRNLQDKHDLSYIFISHDLKVIKALSHDIIVMKDGKIIEQGPAQTLLDNPQHAYTQALLEAALN
ncbi:MAG TPA: dipeptide ABC transporter ATP-binding protein, partial [Marinagarivorans sp.]